MMNRIRTVMIGALVVSGALMVNAQTARPVARTTSAESGLVGIKLYDSGARVIQVYGSPDDILALTSGAAGGAGGGAGGGGGATGTGSSGQGGQTREASLGNRENPSKAPTMIGDPFGTGETEFRQLRAGSEDGAPSGPSGGGDARGASAGDGGGGGSASGGDGRTIYTRWVYKRKNAHYAFVFDKFNRVVQIEALGLLDSKVRTRKGVSFGSHFSDLIKKYGAPDAYEINGDNIVVRYLVKDRVAFRLSRTKPKLPHHVTGVVVAAGKA